MKELVERMPSIKSIDQMWPNLLNFFPKFGKFCKKKEKEEYCSKIFPSLFSYLAKLLAQKN